MDKFTMLHLAIDNFFMIEGFFSWGYLWLVVAQVILCKDVSEANMAKLMSRPLKVRIKLFRRSCRDSWYVGSVGLFIATTALIMALSQDFWSDKPRDIKYVLFHGIFPLSLNVLYYSRGFRAIFFQKFAEWIKIDD